MNSERWRQTDKILQAALELPRELRAAFLDETCSGDEALRREVDSLISSDEQNWSLIDSPVFEVAAPILSHTHPVLDIGQRLAYYEIVELVGKGGMGEVYLAEDERLGRKVALKLLAADLTRNESLVALFQQEARAASSLNHPNILTIHEIGKVDDRQFIATEFIEGETLRRKITREKLSLNEVLDIAVQVTSALVAAHSAGIAHKDIKPENIMVRPDGYVKVLDFGLAELVGPQLSTDQSESQTQKATPVRGTVRYMSPEQARGIPVDPRADIFSLGVVLYEMLAGRVPFEGATTNDLISALLNHEAPPLLQYAPNTPAELQDIVRNTLRKKPDERYQSANELLVHLKRVKQGLEAEARIDLSAKSVADATTGPGGAGPARQLPIRADKEILSPTGADGPATGKKSSSAYIVTKINRHKTGSALILTILAALLAAVVFVLSNYIDKRAERHFQKVAVSQLTTTGKARDATISPDGRYVAYVVDESGEEGLWLKQIPTGDSQEVVAPTGVRYAALTFSPDGNYIFYVKYEKGSTRNALYQVPVTGADPKRIIAEVHSPISFSPDGKHFAFIRRYQGERENALMIAKLDGIEEQELGRRKRPQFFADYPCGAAWSPDGKVIVCGIGDEPGEEMHIVEFHVKNKTEKVVNQMDFKSINGLTWLADASGLIAVSPDCRGIQFPPSVGPGFARTRCPIVLFHIPYPSGEPQRILQESYLDKGHSPTYQGVSSSVRSDALVTTRWTNQSNICVASIDDPNSIQQITSGAGNNIPSLTPDGRIVYSSQASGNEDVWIMDSDGTNKKQLTFNPELDGFAIPSQDGRSIVFSSQRNGKGSIWRMDTDGSNQRQLTTFAGPHDISPDGKWVIISRCDFGKACTLWKVSIEGGEPKQLSNRDALFPVVSPDGKLIAYHYRGQKTDSDKGIGIMSFEGGPQLERFDLPATFQTVSRSQWTPDGRAIIFLNELGGVSNLWTQPIQGSAPTQMTNFKTNRIQWFDLSFDGRSLCYALNWTATDIILISNAKSD